MESIAQLEAERRAMRQQNEAQRQRLAGKYGNEFLALIDSDPGTKVTVTNTVQTLVFQDEERNTISQDRCLLVGKLIEVRFKLLH